MTLQFSVHAFDLAELEYLEKARPVIETFLFEHGREYGIDLRAAPDTWRIRKQLPGPIMIGRTDFYGVVWQSEYLEFSCREISVDLPGRAARAYFYVAKPIPKAGAKDEYRIVASCKPLIDGQPTMYLTPWDSGSRIFNGHEIAARVRPLINNYLALNGEAELSDPPGVRVRRGRSRLREFFFPQPGECHAVDYRLSAKGRTAYVAVRYDEAKFSDRIPLELQTLLKDPVTLRTFRFAVVKGCGGTSEDQPPKITPPPVKPKPAPAEPKSNAPAAPAEGEFVPAVPDVAPPVAPPATEPPPAAPVSPPKPTAPPEATS